MSNIPNSTKKIFIIDDDKFLLDMYVAKFKKAGFEVSAFSSAQEALEKLKNTEDCDIVIFDIIMPGMNGWAFAKEFRKLNLFPHAKIAVLSNQNQREDMIKAEEFKVDLFIVKAFKTPSEVVQEINKII